MDARFAFGSVAETPLRTPEVEKTLIGKELSEDNIAATAEAAKEHVHPITDVRGTAEYRKDMCEVLLKRALMSALERVR